jgi:hypothetical protein
MGHQKVSGGSVAEVATWASRLTADAYRERREWIERLTNPEFELSALERFAKEFAWPRPGDVFEVTLDADAPGADPTKMCDLRFVGRRLGGVLTKRFTLVDIGARKDWGAVISELEKHGALPSGQWRQALSVRFLGEPGYQIGIPDDSWRSRSRDDWSYFMMINGFGSPSWMSTCTSFGAGWLWLVEVA